MLNKYSKNDLNPIISKVVDINDNQRKRLNDRCYVNSDVKGLNSFTNNQNRVVVQARNIHTGKIEQEETHNLIVYHGRSWLMQRAFNLNLGALNRTQNANTSGLTRPNYNNKYLCWLGLGTAGATASVCDPLTPDDSYETDYELGSHATLWDGSSINDGNMRYRDINDNWRDYHAFDTNYPVFLDDWNVTGSQPGYQKDPRYPDYMENVTYNSLYADSYLKALVRTTISPTEANGPKFYDNESAGEYYQDISEAGLFAAPSHNWLDYKNNYLYSANNISQVNSWKMYKPEMFARVCFSTIRKDESREIILNWYLFF